MYLVRSTFCLPISEGLLVLTDYDCLTVLHSDYVLLVALLLLSIQRSLSNYDADLRLLFNVHSFLNYRLESSHRVRILGTVTDNIRAGASPQAFRASSPAPIRFRAGSAMTGLSKAARLHHPMNPTV